MARTAAISAAGFLAVLVLSGCGTSSAAHLPTGQAAICRSVVLNASSHTYTTPGSYTDRGPGSCPSPDLDAVLRLVTGLRHSAMVGADLCVLLPAAYRANAQRWARQNGGTCGQAALREGNVTVGELARPVAEIRLLWTSSAPARKSGFVIFQGDAQDQHVPGGNPLVIAITKQTGKWEVAQLGYQF